MGLGKGFDGLAQTPPMGWNSWNRFACRIDERLIRETAEAMVSNGMADVGYEYVVIDDCWQNRRRGKDGNLQARLDTFPSGIPALAGYVHSLGLKFGIYTCAGRWTCQKKAGSYRKAERDAQLFADWGVDYIKVDWCFSQKPFVLNNLDAKVAYGQWRDAILKTGRPMVFSLCEWGGARPWEWAKTVGHLWRTTGDICDKWSGKRFDVHTYDLGFLEILDRQVDLYPYAGLGHWNDPDMLEVGNGGMTYEEYKSHFSLWCMLAAPLMAGNDLRNITEETRSILTAPEVIAVNQDAFGQQARRIKKDGNLEIWSKELLNPHERAVVLFNRDSVEHTISFDWEEIGLSGIKVLARDLWERKDLGEFVNRFEAPVPPHGVVMVKVTKYIDVSEFEENRLLCSL